jgi:hypothetical protein
VTATETPPEKSRTDAAMTKVGIGLVVVLAMLALVVAATAGSRSNDPVLLGASTPTRVTVPTISAQSDLIGLGREPDGQLSVPPVSRPLQASWWNESPTPGELGPAVILGHVNGGGKPGIFLNLDKIQAGQEILVDRADGQTAVFTVSRVETVPKDAFPAQRVYGGTPDAQLRLITCGGAFDRNAGSYESNIIVFANLTAVRTT